MVDGGALVVDVKLQVLVLQVDDVIVVVPKDGAEVDDMDVGGGL